jgi:hypothetical protein
METKAPDPRAVRARELRGVMSLSEIAGHLGVSRSTICRWIYPGLTERSRALSNEAKKRRVGSCVDCGAQTRYHGRDGKGVSERCHACAAVLRGKEMTKWTEEKVIAAIHDWNRTYGEPPAGPDWNPHSARNNLHDEERAARFEAGDGRWPWFTIVIARFGTWNAAIEAAGFEPRVSGGGGGNACRRRNVTCEKEGAAS